MILNPLLVQRLFELVASWLLRPSAMTAESAPPMRFRRETVVHLTAATTPILHPQPLHQWAACPAPRSAHLDQKSPWNHHLLSNHGISWASVHYLFFFFFNNSTLCMFFLTHHYFLKHYQQFPKPIQKYSQGTSLVVQWLRLCTSTARGTCSIPDWGTRVWHLVAKTKQPNKTKQPKIQSSNYGNLTQEIRSTGSDLSGWNIKISKFSTYVIPWRVEFIE